jgi:hypothetical protein
MMSAHWQFAEFLTPGAEVPLVRDRAKRDRKVLRRQIDQPVWRGIAIGLPISVALWGGVYALAAYLVG